MSSAATTGKVLFRVALVTALFTMLGFALGGFLGVVSIVALRAAHLSITLQDALWFGAIPGGVLGLVAGLVIITVSEQRERRKQSAISH